MIDAVTRARALLARQAAGPSTVTSRDARRGRERARRSSRACAAPSRKLGGDAPERGPIVADARDAGDPRVPGARDAAELVAQGCATPDHVLRTKPTALARPAARRTTTRRRSPRSSSARSPRTRGAYDAYFERHVPEKKVTKTKLDPWPRIVLLPGFGLVRDRRRRARSGHRRRRLRAHDRRHDGRGRRRHVRARVARRTSSTSSTGASSRRRSRRRRRRRSPGASRS